MSKNSPDKWGHCPRKGAWVEEGGESVESSLAQGWQAAVYQAPARPPRTAIIAG